MKEFGCCHLSRTTDLPIMRRRRYLYAILPWLEILLYMDVNISHGVLVQNLPTAETVAPKSVFKKSQQFSMQITQPRFKPKKGFRPEGEANRRHIALNPSAPPIELLRLTYEEGL